MFALFLLISASAIGSKSTSWIPTCSTLISLTVVKNCMVLWVIELNPECWETSNLGTKGPSVVLKVIPFLNMNTTSSFRLWLLWRITIKCFQVGDGSNQSRLTLHPTWTKTLFCSLSDDDHSLFSHRNLFVTPSYKASSVNYKLITRWLHEIYTSTFYWTENQRLFEVLDRSKICRLTLLDTWSRSI